MLENIKRLSKWTVDFVCEAAVYLSGFFLLAGLVIVLFSPSVGPVDLILSVTQGEDIEIESPTDEDVDESEIRDVVFEKTNEKRTQNLPKLRYNDRAEQAAEKHAEDMAENNYFNHTSVDGVSQELRYSFCDGGENIAYTYISEDVERADGSVINHNGNETSIGKGIVNQWMNSKPHREKGIYGEHWTSVGIGVAVDGGKVYVVQGFCQ